MLQQRQGAEREQRVTHGMEGKLKTDNVRALRAGSEERA